MSAATTAPPTCVHRDPHAERAWIAREIHDALGHHVSLIAVQANTGLHLLDVDPDHARRALRAIAQSSRELLADMQATLGVLRGVDPPSVDGTGIARVQHLADESSLAGLPVAVEVRGTLRSLPAAVDATRCRVVQEALTNTRRHSSASHAVVLMDYRRRGVLVRIDDYGADAAGPPAKPGYGLTGMRERVVALGGSLTFGPRDSDGFRVSVWLPEPSRTTRACAEADNAVAAPASSV